MSISGARSRRLREHKHGATAEIAEAIAKGLASREAEADVQSAEAVKGLSSGPLGPPEDLKPEGDPVDVAALMEATGAMSHRMFAGKLDKEKLGFGERAMVRAVRAPEGDFRDWGAIDAFAGEIAERLREISGVADAQSR